MSNSTRAGEGEHSVYRLVAPNSDVLGPIRENEEYLALDACSWFVNESESWFQKRTASGTLRIGISAGAEQYDAALGTFDLANGTRVAPIFDRSVLPNRRYIGGSISISVALRSLKRDTALTTILKRAASASLGIVAGMVETASHAGPRQMLSSAGGELVKGISEALSGSSEGQEPLFAGDGIECTIAPERFDRREMYLLLHRGSSLDPEGLRVGRAGEMHLVSHNGAMLDDGVWILLRLKRSQRYSGYRGWSDAEHALLGRLDDIRDTVAAGLTSPAEALAQLKSGADGHETVFDQFVSTRQMIREDGVLTVGEVREKCAELTQAMGALRAMLAQTIGGSHQAAPIVRRVVATTFANSLGNHDGVATWSNDRLDVVLLQPPPEGRKTTSNVSNGGRPAV